MTTPHFLKILNVVTAKMVEDTWASQYSDTYVVKIRVHQQKIDMSNENVGEGTRQFIGLLQKNYLAMTNPRTATMRVPSGNEDEAVPLN